MKNNEKSENQWNKYEKYNKNNETYGKTSTQWKASKYIIWSHVTPGSRKYSILSVFVFLSLIKSSKITLNNWKTLKDNKQLMKKKQWKKQSSTLERNGSEKQNTNEKHKLLKLIGTKCILSVEQGFIMRQIIAGGLLFIIGLYTCSFWKERK